MQKAELVEKGRPYLQVTENSEMYPFLTYWMDPSPIFGNPVIEAWRIGTWHRAVGNVNW